MTLSDIKNILEGISAFENKVVYYAWPEKEAPTLPWICYYEDESNNFAADGIVFKPILNITIELYSRTKDIASEALIESALNTAGIFWQKSETYIDNENCFVETYEIEV